MNNTSPRQRPLTITLALSVSLLSGTLVAANQQREDTEMTTVASSAEPVTKDAVAQAIEDYVRAKYAGDVEAVKARTHPNLRRRTVADSYWGQPSREWIRPYTQENLTFYADPNAPHRLDNPGSGRCDIEVFDIETMTASARVIMDDVVDYLHLIHFEGRWLIADSAVIILKEHGQRPPATSKRHEEAVTTLARDYCIGFYEIDGDKVQSTCHPSLSKRTIEHAQMPETPSFDYLSQITYEEIKLLGETFNTNWGFDPETARCAIEVYEIRGNIAAVKMTGSVWFDYFHMMKVNGEWSIVNIMYESLDKSRWSDA